MILADCDMLSARELVRKLKEGKEEEEEEKGRGEHEIHDDFGSKTSGGDWRSAGRGKVQIQTQLNQERYFSIILYQGCSMYFQGSLCARQWQRVSYMRMAVFKYRGDMTTNTQMSFISLISFLQITRPSPRRSSELEQCSSVR